MKKLLFLCLFLTGCYSPLYMNDPYQPTNPDNVIMRGRFWGTNSEANEDIGEACPNSEQIAYIRDSNIRPLWFFDRQDVIDKARNQTASLGGDAASVYGLRSLWFILFNISEANSLVYKCNVSNRGYRSTYSKPQTPKQPQKTGYGYQQQYNQQRGYNY